MADLKAGAMGLAQPDNVKPAAFSTSMAEAIENALNTLLVNEGRDALLIDDNSSETRDRRLLFCAIAQGVVNYLHDNDDAFRVHLVFDGAGQVTSASIEIRRQ